jgi:error-prone DNA polymerase
VPPGKTAQQHLEDLTWAGVDKYFGGEISDTLRATLRKELALIAELKYAHYFLTVHDIVHYARSQNILCQGRGSAANSAVCYVLGITSVDPTKVDLLFERFISKERLEPPDIDVDFEHSRRGGGRSGGRHIASPPRAANARNRRRCRAAPVAPWR